MDEVFVAAGKLRRARTGKNRMALKLCFATNSKPRGRAVEMGPARQPPPLVTLFNSSPLLMETACH